MDLTGKRFGRLTVLSRAPRPSDQTYYNIKWVCVCDCGTRRVVFAQSLRNGATKSCGCLRNERGLENLKRVTHRGRGNLRHGRAYTPEYGIWCSMRARCQNPRNAAFPRYGGRGITVCERWQSFENFLSDMGERPPGKTLDRKDNDGNYEPGNCRWATRKEQAQNRSSNHHVVVSGRVLTLGEAATVLGLKSSTLRARLKRFA